MPDLTDFVERFIATEYEARVAAASDPDEGRVQRRLESARAFLHSEPGSNVTLDFGRTVNLPPPQLLSEADARRQFHPRVLFAIVHADWNGRSIARAIAGSAVDPEGFVYDTAFAIEQVNGEPRIVGRAGLDPFASTVGPLEWEPLGGLQPPPDLVPIRVEAVQRPKDPGHAAHYDRLTGGDEHDR